MSSYSHRSPSFLCLAVLPAVLEQSANLPALSPCLLVTSSGTFISFTLPFSPSQHCFGFISFPDGLGALGYHVTCPLDCSSAFHNFPPQDPGSDQPATTVSDLTITLLCVLLKIKSQLHEFVPLRNQSLQSQLVP